MVYKADNDVHETDLRKQWLPYVDIFAENPFAKMIYILSRVNDHCYLVRAIYSQSHHKLPYLNSGTVYALESPSSVENTNHMLKRVFFFFFLFLQ